MARLLALFALCSSAFVAIACENDETPKPEPTTVGAPAPRAPVAVAKADPHAGACGSHAEAKQEMAGAGCGQMAEPKAEAPSGCGCGSHDTGSADKPVVPVTEAKPGDRTRCPVTNSVFVVKGDSPKAEHDGRTYHFCCEGCVSRFRADPKQFLDS